MKSDMSRVNGWETASKYSGAAMALIYIVLGVLMLLNKERFVSTPISSYSTFFGILLIVYGLFRGYNIYHRYFKKSRRDHEI